MFTSILNIALNYLLVQFSIIGFMLPFYLSYRYRHRSQDEVKLDLNQHLERFFLSKQANYLVFFWAMGEALFWFVIPEFLLLLVVFMRIRRKKELLTYDIAGTLIGTIVAYWRLNDCPTSSPK
jgi:O-antigen/teichoic acid export membrane protein